MARKSKQRAAKQPAQSSRSTKRKPARKAQKRVARKPANNAPAKQAKRHAARPTLARAAPIPLSRPTVISRMATLAKDRRALRMASFILGIIALLHLFRFVIGFTLMVDDIVLPLNASGVIVVIFGVLSLWYYRLSLD